MLNVIDRASNSGLHFRYNCVCDCGNKTVVFGSNLLRGHTKSCGCLLKTRAITHGASNHTLFRCWQAMVDRCTNKNHIAYSRYGGRGIEVFPLWISNPLSFFEYIGDRPTPRHSIDRFPNNDGNYEPGNVRWATPSEQMANARSSINISAFGLTRNLRQWGLAIGVSRAAIKRYSSRHKVSLSESVVFYAKQRNFPLSTQQQTEIAA